MSRSLSEGGRGEGGGLAHWTNNHEMINALRTVVVDVFLRERVRYGKVLGIFAD